LEYRQLGDTGLCVSRIALGTVELGMDYGFRGLDRYQRPDPSAAIKIVHRALDLGINLIDTARAYGTSEALIGKALSERPANVVVASKVAVPEDTPAEPNRLREAISSSIEASLRSLQIETIDLMQIHNFALSTPKSDGVWRALEDARQAGKIRFLGASCYGEEAPLTALNDDHINTLQVPFNVLDRRVLPRVFPGAVRRSVGILTRSAFLRGVLTIHVNSVPEQLAPVRQAALRVLAVAREAGQSISETALRFCLSFDEVSSVIVGVRSVRELESNVADGDKGALATEVIEQLRQVTVLDDSLLDPINWRGLI